jgi:uncharacterized protein (DUF1015 family)
MTSAIAASRAASDRSVRAQGASIVFVTNNAARPPAEVAEQLQSMGVDATPRLQRIGGAVDGPVADVGDAVEVDEERIVRLPEHTVTGSQTAPRAGPLSRHRCHSLPRRSMPVMDNRPSHASAARPDESVPRPDGLVLAPFRALRYDLSKVTLANVLAPPYDVIDEAERASLEAKDEHNVVRLTLPRDDDGEGSRYAAAHETLQDWRTAGVLTPDAEPALYVYEQRADGHTQRGIVGALGLTPAEDAIVLPHENTMAGPVADRLALMEATEADLEMIFLVYDGGGATSRAVAGAEQQSPLVDVSTEDGVQHRVWAITDPATLTEIAADLHPRRAVIADGHHRYATFRQYQADRHAAGSGSGPWDLGLAFLVDGSAFGPQVHAIHRAVPGLAAPRAVELAASGFEVSEIAGGLPAVTDVLAKAGVEGVAFVISDGSRAWLLTDPDRDKLAAALPAERSAAWRALDVAVAHGYLIRDLWNLEDREDIVEFHHDVESAARAATSSGGVALLLNPTPVADVAAVAAEGDRMPRKSTLFVPKPATGLLIRAFADGGPA